MLPEDLVPTASTPLWGSVRRVDWTATPMLAIQELVRCPRTDGASDLPSGGRLADILSPQEITSLLEIFETRYTPWICAQPGPLECTNSLLDIVRCTVASRHLAPAARSVIAPRLQKLTEDAFIREIFNPQPPLESIKALLILSVWAPICGTGAEARDGRLLIVSAVSMAMNLHLQDDSSRATALRADMDKLSPARRSELYDSTERWRLWMYLSISESMLCMGTGRTPVSHISQLDNDITNTIALPKLSCFYFRDIRLGLSAKIVRKTCEFPYIVLPCAYLFGDAFFAKINSTMYTMEGIGRLLTPCLVRDTVLNYPPDLSSVVTQHDVFYSQMLILQYHACRHWGRAALTFAEAVLAAFLAPTDLMLLSTAPDNFYVMVAFAATWIFISNFSIHQLGSVPLRVGGSSELLQKAAIARLNETAHAPDHAAARSGHVLGALLSAWQRRNTRVEQDGDMVRVCVFMLPTAQPTDSYSDYLGLNPPNYPDIASGAGEVPTNQDLFMDDEFWNVFIENLQSANAETFIAQNYGVLDITMKQCIS
ncbi:hypothetical protein DFH07DRAFT_733706 [Mycena maculata]|uniref:Xylanolytic transcriptional activator regulatory domain-containing protein n=1 Tax=Mycena maculata TaxID=230809 RepID=A0AAD7JXX8_9AGAR|nr:hypothetical protein DFH07DRAFT_733706 [Mycena maculata]